MGVSVAIITFNEEANIGRTLASVAWAGERIVVDSGSTDRTCDIARQHGARVFQEPWKGFAAQKNSAIDKTSSEWVLSLDADEEVDPVLAREIQQVTTAPDAVEGYFLARKNYFLGRWIRHGGFYPDRKLRLTRQAKGRFVERAVHETMRVEGRTENLRNPLIHHAYPTLTGYIQTMNRYSSLAADLAQSRNEPGASIFSFFVHVFLRPAVNFAWNYFARGGFLDGREGLLLHAYHNVYVSWKYAKSWELSRVNIKVTKENSEGH